MIPLIPLAVLALGGTAWHFAAKRKLKGVMTPQRLLIYQTLLKTEKDPAVLIKFADLFTEEGLILEGDLLRKRANLKITPPEVRAQRKDVIKQALQSTDPVAVKAVADAFHSQGATGTAAQLNAHAAGLQQLQTAGVDAAKQVANTGKAAVNAAEQQAKAVADQAVKAVEKKAADAVANVTAQAATEATQAIGNLFNGEEIGLKTFTEHALGFDRPQLEQLEKDFPEAVSEDEELPQELGPHRDPNQEPITATDLAESLNGNQ